MLTRLFGKDMRAAQLAIPTAPQNPPPPAPVLSSETVSDYPHERHPILVADLAHEIGQAADKAFAKADAASRRGDLENLAPLYLQLGTARSKTARSLSSKDEETLQKIWH